MAVYSMTGYANASATAGSTRPAADEDGEPVAAVNGGVTVELRSVNSRFLDLVFRLPDELRGVEPALRELLNQAFRRGKIELRLAGHREDGPMGPQPTPDLLNQLTRLESTVQGWLPKATPLTVHEALQWCRQATPTQRLDDAALKAARRCIDGLKDARRREGERLVAVLMERVARLRELADQARPLVPQVVQRQQQRFLERWQEALSAANAGGSVSPQALQERALGEAATFALRIDVAEELARLGSHLDEIERLLQAGGEVGKRLDFLIQELQREANTLGSKSAALELTGLSVEMKVAIEQMREQVQNLE
jgi:uncharacterized protein (TIGR00255 family)